MPKAITKQGATSLKLQGAIHKALREKVTTHEAYIHFVDNEAKKACTSLHSKALNHSNK